MFITLEPINKHLGANGINRFCFINGWMKNHANIKFIMDEWKIMKTLGLLMNE
jgi:hypothetical protein